MKRAILAFLVIGLVVPALAGADEPCMEPCARQAVIGFLELAPEQVEQWDMLLAVRDETVTALREQLVPLEEQLRELLGEPDPDPVEVGQLTIQIHELREQIGEANRAYLAGFESMLEEEQAGRLVFLRRADRAKRLFPAFRAFGLLPRR